MQNRKLYTHKIHRGFGNLAAAEAFARDLERSNRLSGVDSVTTCVQGPSGNYKVIEEHLE